MTFKAGMTLKAEDTKRAREILRGWVTDGPISGGYGSTPIPVDDMSDEQIAAVVCAIAQQPDPAA